MDVVRAREMAQDIVLLFASIMEQLNMLDGSDKQAAKTKVAKELTCAAISNPNYGTPGIKTCVLDKINQELLEKGKVLEKDNNHESDL